jgi:hypothetical protein
VSVSVTRASYGSRVVFTVTVTNVGKGDYTVTDPASVTDTLTGVLDDASYNADARSSDGGVTYSAPELTWTGPIAGGDSVTLTYSVTVGAEGAGDGWLRNVIGLDRATADPATYARCSANPLDNADDHCLLQLEVLPLADTGSTIPVVGLLLGLLGLSAGFLLLLVGRARREQLAQR